MAISETYAATIIFVRVRVGLSKFTCDPDEITQTLQLQPDEVERKGEFRILPNGQKLRVTFNQWILKSRIESKDVNEHIRELLQRLGTAKDRFDYQTCMEQRGHRLDSK